MTTDGCSLRRHIPHDIGPEVDVIQISSDGGASLYQVQVNCVPDTELHMTPFDANRSMVVLRGGDNSALDRVFVNTTGDDWVTEAHNVVGTMLKNYYKEAIVSWFTRGQQKP